MRFTKPFWAGIENGEITVAFRRWTRPTVVVDRIYRTGGGRVRVLEVNEAEVAQIAESDVTRAGYASAEDLVAALRDGEERRLYRVRFELVDEPDPREVLAADDDLAAADIEAISTRLDRYDAASSFGAWTRPTLALIGEQSGTRAPDLAEQMGRETKRFKLDVRKLKNMGLTHSLKIGYELSPRGRAYLDALDGNGA